MDRQTISKMLEEAPVVKNPRTLTCGCGVIVKVSRYKGNEPYKCNKCRNPKPKS